MVFQDIDPLRFAAVAQEVNVPNVPFASLSVEAAREIVPILRGDKRKRKRQSAGDVGGDFRLGGGDRVVFKGIAPTSAVGALATGALVVAEAAELDTFLFNVLKGVGQTVGGALLGQLKEGIEGALPGRQFGNDSGVQTSSGGGALVPQPGEQIAVAGLQAGAPLPSMGSIAKVWDTWPGAGVTGGGRAPIFIRTVDGRTFVRKLDGTVKKVPKSRNIVINTRKIDLNQYIRAERRLESISKRIAKRVRSLKRA